VNKERPTFGSILNSTSTNSTEEKKEKEIGAIWSRTTKSNSKFLSIKLNITKEQLKQLAETTEDVVSVNLVAFPNRYKEESDNRPDFRIYEERKRV
jgi:uncharacterized protein (DUF736 family)